MKKNNFTSKIVYFFIINKKTIIVWLLILLLIAGGIYLHIDKGIITVAVIVLGFISNAFAGLASIVSMVPIIGPLIVKVLSLPVFWLLNSMGYFVSAVAIKKGYKREVINYRIITVFFLLGFAVGFVIAKLL